MSKSDRKTKNIDDYLDSKGKWRFDKSENIKNARRIVEENRKLSRPIDTRTELQRIFAKS